MLRLSVCRDGCALTGVATLDRLALMKSVSENVLAGALPVSLNGEAVLCLRSGACYLPDAGTLIVADLHFEKGSAYAARGQMLPPYDTIETLAALSEIVDALRPSVVVSLGDAFHDPRAMSRMPPPAQEALTRLTSAADWVWISGNHDPSTPDHLAGLRTADLAVGALTLRHEPTVGSAEGEVAGHLHPCARVASRAGTVRARCFAFDRNRIVLPAFGALTGSLNVCDPAFAGLFEDGLVAGVIGRDRVYATPSARLVPDRAGPGVRTAPRRAAQDG